MKALKIFLVGSCVLSMMVASSDIAKNPSFGDELHLENNMPIRHVRDIMDLFSFYELGEDVRLKIDRDNSRFIYYKITDKITLDYAIVDVGSEHVSRDSFLDTF